MSAPTPPMPSAELVFVQIEAALAVGQIDRARQLVAWAHQAYGPSTALKALAERVDDAIPTVDMARVDGARVRPPASALDEAAPTMPLRVAPAAPAPPPLPTAALAQAPPAQVEAWVAEAQAHLRAADYQRSLDLLHRALAAMPGEPNLVRQLQSTEKAAARHRAATVREQAVARAARDIEGLLIAGELPEARGRLREALAEHGKHPTFESLQLAIQQKVDGQRRFDAGGALQRAKALVEAKDWHGALSQADQALALDPDPASTGHMAALKLQQQAQAQVAQIEKTRQKDEAIAAAARDVERLLAAREPQQAAARLAQAVQKLGRDPAFEALAKKVDEAKTDLQYQLKNEWAERRAHEAEALIQEAVRLSLTNDFGRAVEKLEHARKLEPDHPELENKLAVARGLMQKQRAEQEKIADLDRLLGEAGDLLDELELDRADTLLQRTLQRHGPGDRLNSLRQRLEQLRQAQRGADILVTPADLPRLDRATAQAIADRQRLVVDRYGWDQALLYPLRGRGPWALAFCVLLLLALDAAAFALGILGALRTLAPLALFALATPLVGAALRGRDELSITDFKPAGSMMGILATLTLPLFFVLPGFFLVATRNQHDLLGPASPPWIWLLLAAAFWPILPLLLPLLGSSAAFGNGQLPRLFRHLRALFGDGGHAWGVVICGLFFAFLAIWLRVVVGRAVPLLGLPAAALVTAYAVLLIPHLIGVNFRRRRLELAQLYA